MQHRQRRNEDLHLVELRDQQDEPCPLRLLQGRPQHLRQVSRNNYAINFFKFVTANGNKNSNPLA